jgi:hypothetical protein
MPKLFANLSALALDRAATATIDASSAGRSWRAPTKSEAMSPLPMIPQRIG